MSPRARRNLREVRISVCLPATVVALVSSTDDGDLTIESIRRIDCEASARGVTEQMRDEDLDALQQAYSRAKDLP